MRMWLLLILSLLPACAQLPEATGEMAQAISSTSNAVQAEVVDKVINNEINIPLKYVMALALVAWCVRTPWGLVSDFITVRRS